VKFTRRAALGAVAGWLACAGGGALAAQAPRMRTETLSGEARSLAAWVRRTRDAAGKPWVVVDKKAARMHVHDARGRLLASTPVLLGATPGDHSVPGVGERAQAGLVGPDERTTPAGRYDTQPGTNIDGESIVWLDWDAALAIHRLRPGRAHGLRQARLQGRDPQGRRLSLGCVVVPVDFYLQVVEPLLGKAAGVVYVLPEVKALHEVFAPV
jgi:hypothetical protein